MASRIPRAIRGKALAALAVALASPLAQGGVGLDSNLHQRILPAHTRERAAVGVAPLAWSPALARDAQAWGEHLVRLGYLKHSEDDPADPDPEGENLWAGTRGYYGPEAMVGLWIAEKKNYIPGAPTPDNSRTGDFEDVGHYTQVTWRSSKQVGCAVAHGASDDFLVCRYAEGGNVIGEKPY